MWEKFCSALSLPALSPPPRAGPQGPPQGPPCLSAPADHEGEQNTTKGRSIDVPQLVSPKPAPPE